MLWYAPAKRKHHHLLWTMLLLMEEILCQLIWKIIPWFAGFYASQVLSRISSITRRFTSTMLRDSLGILPFIAPDVSATPTPLTTTTTTTATTTTANQQIKNGQRFRIRQDLCIIQTHVDSYPRSFDSGMEKSIHLHCFNQLRGANCS